MVLIYQAEKGKEVSEDQRDDIKNEVQERTKKYEEKASQMAKTREEEVMDN